MSPVLLRVLYMVMTSSLLVLSDDRNVLHILNRTLRWRKDGLVFGRTRDMPEK